MAKGFKFLSEEDFKDGVKSGFTLVDFHADWCGPCRMLAPVLERVAEKMSGKVTFAKIDIDQAQKTAATYQVTSIPTLILFKDGKEIARLVGLRDEEALKDFIHSAMSRVPA